MKQPDDSTAGSDVNEPMSIEHSTGVPPCKPGRVHAGFNPLPTTKLQSWTFDFDSDDKYITNAASKYRLGKRLLSSQSPIRLDVNRQGRELSSGTSGASLGTIDNPPVVSQLSMEGQLDGQ